MKRSLSPFRASFLLTCFYVLGFQVLWCFAVIVVLAVLGMNDPGKQPFSDSFQADFNGNPYVVRVHKNGEREFRGVNESEFSPRVPGMSESEFSPEESSKQHLREIPEISLSLNRQQRSSESKSFFKPVNITCIADRNDLPRLCYFVCHQEWFSGEKYGYFEVYDFESRDRLYFVGKNGRSETLPSKEQSFEMNADENWMLYRHLLAFGELSSSGQSRYAFVPSEQSIRLYAARSVEPSKRLMLKETTILDADGFLWSINLQTQEVAKLDQYPDVRSVIRMPLKIYEAFVEGSEAGSHAGAKAVTVWAVSDRVIFDTVYGIFEIRIPDALQSEKKVEFSLLPDGKVLYSRWRMTGAFPGRPVGDLIWASPAGEILEEKLALIQGGVDWPVFLRKQAWELCFSLTPHLVGYFVHRENAVSLLNPTSGVSKQEARRYVTWLTWDILVVVSILAAACCVVYWRLARRRGVKTAWWHWGFLVLFGPVGLVGLWLQLPKVKNLEELEVLPTGTEIITAYSPNSSLQVGFSTGVG